MTQSSLFGDDRGDHDADPGDAGEADRTGQLSIDVVLIYCDGGSRGNPGPSAIGAVVLDPATDPPRRLAEVSECIGITTNNIAEYKALIEGLLAAEPFGARRARVRADSKLVVEQVKGTWKVKQPHLLPLRDEARRLLARYDDVDIRHVPRAENFDADALVNAALDAAVSEA